MNVMKRLFHTVTAFCAIYSVLIIAELAGVNFLNNILFTPFGMFMVFVFLIIELEFMSL